jgi:hypothetical protein
MSTTLRSIITLCLKEAGVAGVGQTALPQDTSDSFTLLSRMLAAWQVKRWMVPGLTDISAVANGSISNTIGPGQYYNAIRPDKIQAAYFTQLNTGNPVIVSYPLIPIWSYEDYARIALKNLVSWPQRFFYDGAFPNGNVFIWPVPTNQFQIHLIVKLPITNQTSIDLTNGPGGGGVISNGGTLYTNGFYPSVALTGGLGSGATADITVTAGLVAIVGIDNPGNGYNINDILTAAIPGGSGFTWTINSLVSTLDTVVNVPDYFLEAIHYNLCLRICSAYQYEPSIIQAKLAKISLNTVKLANAQVPNLVMPFNNRTGFNIYAPDVYQ